VTSPEQKNPQSEERDTPDTEVIVRSDASPVFVDATGRRRRLLRRLTYAFAGLCMVYGGLISVSLAGGPVSSSAILPVPDHDEKPADPRPDPTPTPAATTPKAEPIIEALPRRTVPLAHPDLARRSPPGPARPAAPAPPKPTPSPKVSTTKPAESTTTPAPSGTSPTSGATAPPVVGSPSPPAPRPPSVSPTDGDSSGAGDTPAPPAPPVVEDDPAETAPAPTPDPQPLPRDSVTLEVSA
jgi:hypothetical protein